MDDVHNGSDKGRNREKSAVSGSPVTTGGPFFAAEAPSTSGDALPLFTLGSGCSPRTHVPQQTRASVRVERTERLHQAATARIRAQ